MTRVRVNVTQRDIERGLPTHPHRCPIARAIKRAVPADADRIHVGWEVVDIGDDTVDLPLPVIVFINDFDRHHPVEPFTFTLEVPE